MALEKFIDNWVPTLNGEFLSSILHFMPLIYPVFACVDPDQYSEYGSGYTNVPE